MSNSTVSSEEKLAELDRKINYHTQAIQKLMEKKSRISNPPQRKKKVTIKDVVFMAKQAGMDAETIMRQLNLKSAAE